MIDSAALLQQTVGARGFIAMPVGDRAFQPEFAPPFEGVLAMLYNFGLSRFIAIP